MALPLKKSRCGYIIVANVWCQKKGTHIWKKTLNNLNWCLSKPKNDKKKEVTSPLNNASPIYLVGCLIQKRRVTFFQIRLQQGSFLVLYNWSPHFWMRRGESLQNPLRHMGMARLDQFYSCVCVWMDLQDRQFSIVMCASGFTCRGFQLLLGWIVGTSWIKACWIERKTEKSTVKKFIRLFWS